MGDDEMLHRRIGASMFLCHGPWFKLTTGSRHVLDPQYSECHEMLPGTPTTTIWPRACTLPRAAQGPIW